MSSRIPFVIFACFLASAAAFADPPQDGRPLPLPATLQDSGGYNWDLQRNGRIMDGSRDSYDGAARLQVNGQDFPELAQGIASADGREVWIGPAQVAGISVTRRMRVSAEGPGWARFIDELRNDTPRPVTINAVITTDMGSDSDTVVAGSSSGDNRLDPEDWGFFTDDGNGGANDPVLVHIFGSAGGSHPDVGGGNGADGISYGYPAITLEPGQRKLIACLESQHAARDSAQAFLAGFDAAQAFKDLEPSDRADLFNFQLGGAVPLGELPIKRDPFHDIVVMATGDVLFGEAARGDLTIATAFGLVKVPASDLAGFARDPLGMESDLLSRVGDDVFRGKLEAGEVRLKLGSGQELAVPLDRVKSVGYRLREDEPKPDASSAEFELVSGDRFRAALRLDQIRLLAPYAEIAAKPAGLSRIELWGEAAPLHRVLFRTGDRFTGTVMDAEFPVTLGGGLQLSLRRDLVSSIELPSPPASDAAKPSAGPEVPEVALGNGDRFRASIMDEKLLVDTPYGRVEVSPTGFREVLFDSKRWRWVTVTLWDGGRISGRLGGAELRFKTVAGPELSISPVYVERIALAAPQIPKQVREGFEELILRLGDPSWEVRESTHARLKQAGPTILPILEDYADHPDAEIRSRVQKLIGELKK